MDAEVQAQEFPTQEAGMSGGMQAPTEAAPVVTEKDLSRFRSAYDRLIAEERRKREEAERQLQALSAKLAQLEEQLVEQRLEQLPPEEAERFRQELAQRKLAQEMARRDQEIERLRRELAERERREATARRMKEMVEQAGLSVRDPRLDYSSIEALAVSIARALREDAMKQTLELARSHGVERLAAPAPQERPARQELVVDTGTPSGSALGPSLEDVIAASARRDWRYLKEIVQTYKQGLGR